MKILFFTITTSLFLFGCSGASFNTNVGSYAKHKYRMIAVKEYSLQEMITYQAESIGALSASYCQQNLDEPRANESFVIEELKAKVYQKGGNGLVVEQCQSSQYRSCESYTECHGVAYRVPDN